MVNKNDIVIAPTGIERRVQFNPQSALERLHQLEFVRVTSLKLFEQCPHTWAFRYLNEGEQKRSKYGEIGTAVHLVIEHFISAMFGGDSNENTVADALQKVPEEETEPLMNYLNALTGLTEGKLIALEYEFTLNMPGVGPAIRGHMDAIFENKDGTIVILDHKTNRSYDTKVWWSKQLQPLLYAWAARKLWPGRPVMFCIGYVNLGKCVPWLTEPEDDAYLERRIARIWESMQEYASVGSWPQTFNEHCKYCPIKDTCGEHRHALTSLKDTFMNRVGMKTAGERYVWLQCVIDTASAMAEELKEQLIAEAQENEGVLQHGPHRFTTSFSERRQITPTDVISAIWDAGMNPQAILYSDDVDKIFSAKVTALDKLCIKYPKLRKEIDARTQKVKSERPTLRVSSDPVGGSLTK